MSKLIKTLIRAIGSSYTRYKGCLIERRDGKYIALGQPHDTQDLARQYIDQVLANLKTTAA